MTINQYIDTVNKRYKAGISREHSYRGDFENLFRELIKGVEITNEPANVTDCGNPDYVITKGKIPIGYIEAKDIDKDLNSKSYKEQFGRYRKALDNLIITNYIWFQFFQNGNLVHEIRIAEIDNGTIKPLIENFVKFENLLNDFSVFIGQTIKSPKKLAELMASKAKLLQDILERAITSDEETDANTSLRSQLESFKQILINDITPKAFADLYAQTLAYGMFAARLHDPTLEDFSRQEAADLIPKTNPFLRKLFQYIAGYDIDIRIKTTVENLADIFRATDVKSLLNNFGKSTQQNDPIIHFYETFLTEFDPKLKKKRGVWYTPEPVVKFIVRSIDEILKTEFEINEGLADTSKTKINVKVLTKATSDRRSKTKEVEIEKEVHKIQILDPATGTGTFLAEVVKFIYEKRFKSMQGIWSSYIENDLIPRLNGFELLMASYSMAHLKLDLLLGETGYKSIKEKRFNVYLTNSLEPGIKEIPNLFMAQWLTEESVKANEVKQNKPVMVVLGNPPYSGASSNKGEWILNLMKDYKFEPGGKEKLKEQNPKWLNGDENKFIRYGQYFIEKNGTGVLAYINPHSFLDNPTFRGMRWHLLKTFDTIFTIDLHGNSTKKETAPDGSADINVFDIKQGVSINFFIKTGKKKTQDLAEVFHYDLYGKREFKYDFLLKNTLKSIKFQKIQNKAPYYLFTPKNYDLEEQYKNGLNTKNLFIKDTLGFQTHRDGFAIDFEKKNIELRISDFKNELLETETLRNKYQLKNNRDWKLEKARTIVESDWESLVIECDYRPFDSRWCFFSYSFMDYPRTTLIKHVANKDNHILILPRQCVTEWRYVFISKKVIEANLTGTAGRYGAGYAFPLYLYPDTKEQLTIEHSKERKPNLNKELVNKIAEKLGVSFTSEKSTSKNTFAPIDLLDYIYAVLHSPNYREKYNEFLKIDFPRVPYPKDKKIFWELVQLGGEIRQIHLLESSKIEDYITSYPKNGDNTITRKIVKKDWELFDEEKQLGRIWINDEQYFDKIPLKAWEFYIGGYQPAQKWLKDRKGKTLNFDDILHYQKIIVALNETDRLMKEIDKIEIE